MGSDIVAALLLLVIPAVLWAIPRTRRLTGNWIVALKSVPVGCAAVTVVMALALGCVGLISQERFPVFRWLLMLFFLMMGIGIGAGVIFGIARFIRRRYRAANRRAILPFVILFLLFGIATVSVSVAYSVIQSVIALHSGEHFVGDWRSFELPPEQGVELAFEERPIHPFQAEYEYRLRFGKADGAVYRYLRVNTGGRTAFNVYRLKDGRLFLRDKDGEYLVDAAARQLLVLFEYDGKEYVAACPDRVFHDYGWITQEGETVFYAFDDQKVEAQPLPPDLFDGWSFYGSISNQFFPAAERGELAFPKKPSPVPPVQTAPSAGD